MSGATIPLPGKQRLDYLRKVATEFTQTLTALREVLPFADWLVVAEQVESEVGVEIQESLRGGHDDECDEQPTEPFPYF